MGNSCQVPGDLAAELPGHLNIDQFLRLGAVNALIANTDSPIFKDNNYYFYDWPGTRYYLPWDLDTVMKDSGSAMVQDTGFASVLFTHWEGDYRVIFSELLSGPLTLAAIHGELDRILAVAGPAIAGAGADAAAIVAGLEGSWSDRHALASSQF